MKFKTESELDLFWKQLDKPQYYKAVYNGVSWSLEKLSNIC